MSKARAIMYGAIRARVWIDYQPPLMLSDVVGVTDFTLVSPVYNLNLAEVVGIGENVLVGTQPRLGDTATVTDGVALSYGFIRTVDDVVTMSDNVVPILTFGTAPNDTVAMDESLVFAVSHPLADSVTMSEAPSFAFSKSLTDSVTMSDATAKAASPATVADSVTMSDQLLTGNQWNPNDKAATATLSNANLTVSTGSGGFVSAGVRSLTSHNSGKYHFEITVTESGPYWQMNFGVANASANLSGPAGDANSIVFDAFSFGSSSSPVVEFNGANQGALDGVTSGVIVAIEVDIDNKNFYVQKQGGTRKGPFSFSSMTGSVFYAFARIGVNTETITANFTSGFVVTPTAGYNPWG
jgi:hypothetical protein